MTCTEAQEWLLSQPVRAFGQIEPHLRGCARCRRLADRIRRDEAGLDAELEDFAQAVGFADAWDALGGEAPTEPRRTSMYGWIAGMAAAATLAFAVSPGSAPDRSAPGTTPSCAQLEPLEPLALQGQLSEAQLACLSERLDEGALPQGEQIRISRLKLAHLWVAEDWLGWEAQIRHHLDRIQPRDPDLAYKLALYLSQEQPIDADGVLRYAELALEHSGAWNGEAYAVRVENLHQLRAQAATAAWQQAEEEGQPTEALRARARAYAQEWAELAQDLRDEGPEAADP